jgi:hypothetical protein
MIETFTDVDIVVLQRMIFIYNAIMAGWTVEKSTPTEVSFTRRSDRCTINLEEFVNGNLKIPDDWKNMLKE